MTDGAAGGKWGDLASRLGTSAVLVTVGVAAIWAGGAWFAALVVLAVAAIGWELSAMAQAARPVMVAAVAGLALGAVLLLPPGWGLPLVLVPVLVAQPGLRRAHLAHGVFLTLAILAGYGLVDLRGDASALWLVWLVAVVAVTDIAGYFAGRMIGGPKFWPRVSPKKTWSGTVAGWIGAGLLGAVFWARGLAGPEVVALSVAMAMASQLGDIAQSALKRHVGVKDSSRLLPGHGGVFDRFDGLLGASVFLLLVERVVDFPPVAA
ncbi:phosphatidate cytidylyltransferase [Meridianimarinicoccus sp. RP-17]|uniref:phosphatidate cytidylyltransferase n=1 Tax=Meridianimarinicoccus zhengii TaxID=2056810 RepID=UPI000DAE54FE|nr:phosphatidate cytidylyltransferase [Phycocomes zhengii]